MSSVQTFRAPVNKIKQKLAQRTVPPPPIEDTIFHQDWMLEAASLGRWDQVEVRQDGNLVASLPYMIWRKFGTQTVGMPYYCRVLGPVIRRPAPNPNRQLEYVTDLIVELHSKLPPHDRFSQSIGPENDYTTGFVLSGYSVKTGYTFRITPDSVPDTVLATMKGAMRRNIVTTFDRMTVRQHTDLDEFISLAMAHGPCQGESRYRFDEIQTIFTAAAQRGQATILTAYDESGQNMGTTMLLYDSRVAYFWLTARHLVPGNRAYSRLLWESYKFAHARGLTFDLDGYPSLAGARFLANFGGVPAIRNIVERSSLWVDTLYVGKRIGKALNEQAQRFGRSARKSTG